MNELSYHLIIKFFHQSFQFVAIDEMKWVLLREIFTLQARHPIWKKCIQHTLIFHRKPVKIFDILALSKVLSICSKVWTVVGYIELFGVKPSIVFLHKCFSVPVLFLSSKVFIFSVGIGYRINGSKGSSKYVFCFQQMWNSFNHWRGYVDDFFVLLSRIHYGCIVCWLKKFIHFLTTKNKNSMENSEDFSDPNWKRIFHWILLITKHGIFLWTPSVFDWNIYGQQ